MCFLRDEVSTLITLSGWLILESFEAETYCFYFILDAVPSCYSGSLRPDFTALGVWGILDLIEDLRCPYRLSVRS